MPRFIKSVTPPPLEERQQRAKSFRVTGQNRWIDPFLNVHGTLPEKMVYEALTQRKIPFYFLNDIRINIPELRLVKDFQADFFIPSLALIIEVQGAFWHSKPKTIEADALKFALYQQMGYKVIAWWDFDIITRLNELFAQEPLLARFHASTGNKSAELPPKKRTKVDTSKGIRTLNKRRGDRLLYRKKAPKLKDKRNY